MERKVLKSRGQGMVEFALTLPLLLFLVVGVIEFGRLLFFYSAITTGTREAARYGAAAGGFLGKGNNFQDCQGIRDAAKRMATLAGVQDKDIAIVYDQGPGGAVLGNCPVGGEGPFLELGDRVVVTVTGSFQPFIPFFKMPPLTIQSVARRTVIRDVIIQ